ncbi:MAG: ferritin family protein [Candidatus Omnitrophota bacterium]
MMGNIFAGSEIVEIGIQIEKNGKDFYDETVKRSKSQKAKEIFQYLASEEEKHIAMFRTILDAVHKYEPAEAYPGEYFAYMNALASGYVFTQENKGKEVAASTKSDLEAIDMGIKFEKDSIVFYEGMKKVVPEHENKIVDELIDQEKSHLAKLVVLKKEL